MEDRKRLNNKIPKQSTKNCQLTLSRQQVHLSTTMEFWLTGLVITGVEIFGIFGIVSELLLAHRFSESEFSKVKIFGISELFRSQRDQTIYRPI